MTGSPMPGFTRKPEGGGYLYGRSENGVMGAPGADGSDFGRRIGGTVSLSFGAAQGYGQKWSAGAGLAFWYRSERNGDGSRPLLLSGAGINGTGTRANLVLDPVAETIEWTMSGGQYVGLELSDRSISVGVPGLGDHEWHFISASREAVDGEITVNVDGKELGRVTPPSLSGNPSTFLGWDLTGGDGIVVLDEMKIFAGALSRGQVDDLMNRRGENFCLLAVSPELGTRSEIDISRITYEEVDVRGGRISAEAVLKVKVDGTAPSSAVASMPLVAGASGAPVTTIIGGTATDGAGSGIGRVEVSVNGGEWVAADGLEAWVAPLVVIDGEYSIRTRAVDRVGNVGEPSAPTVLVVDGAAPAVSMDPLDDVVAPTGAGGRRAVSLSGTVTDDASGLSADSDVLVQLVAAGETATTAAWQEAVFTPTSNSAGSWSVEAVLPPGLVGSFGSVDVVVSVQDVLE
ncbi:MAG: hypothetical protein ACO23O_14430, partial [Ilumatobacteraceae bacterium]